MEQKSWREKDFLSVSDIVRIFEISRESALDIVRQLPHVRIGVLYRVNTKALEKWIRDQERRSTGA